MDGGWRYIFRDCALSFAAAGRTCGENGGRCANGKPCGRKVRGGRCGNHPYREVVVTFDGDDGKIRPFPCDVAWESVRIEADGAPVVVETPPVPALPEFYSATHVWNREFALSFEELGLQPRCEAEWRGSTVRLNPLWTTERLQSVCPGCRVLNGRKVVPGFMLEDYNVVDSTLNKLI